MRTVTKFSVFLLSLILSHSLRADSLAFGFGGVTTHMSQIDAGKRYCNELKDTGIIYNQAYYLRYRRSKWAYTGFVGQDSICSPIWGIMVNRTLWEGDFWRTSFVLGAYKFDMEHWDRWETQTLANPTPKDHVPPEPVSVRLGDIHLVPVVGLEFSLRLFQTPYGGLWLNNLISPIITNHSLSYVIDF